MDELISSPDGYINGFGYVDLGLPSGTLWATCNVLAKEPWEGGGYFGWGETEEHQMNLPQSYPFYNTQIDEISGLTPQVNDSLPLRIEGNPKYDVASKKWGNPWQIPNIKNWLEIIGPDFLNYPPTSDYYPSSVFYDNERDINPSLCQFEIIEVNGQVGTKVIGPNGKSIFLPSAGLKTTSIFYKDMDAEGIYQCANIYRNTTGIREISCKDGFMKIVHRFNLDTYVMRAEFKTNEKAQESSRQGFYTDIRIEIEDLYKGLTVRPVINRR